MSKAYLGKEGGWGGSRLGTTGSASWRLGGLGDPRFCSRDCQVALRLRLLAPLSQQGQGIQAAKCAQGHKW